MITTNMKNGNNLSPAEAERLALLMEEFAEVQQVIGKILRHGYESYHPDSPKIFNRMLLEKEIGHAMWAILFMIDCEDLNSEAIADSHKQKSEKVWQYVHHNDRPEE